MHWAGRQATQFKIGSPAGHQQCTGACRQATYTDVVVWVQSTYTELWAHLGLKQHTGRCTGRIADSAAGASLLLRLRLPTGPLARNDRSGSSNGGDVCGPAPYPPLPHAPPA